MIPSVPGADPVTCPFPEGVTSGEGTQAALGPVGLSPDQVRALKNYARAGRRRVEGWLSRIDARISEVLLLRQIEAGCGGGIAEIGVHQGRYLILLLLSLRSNERGYCIDIFEEQYRNIDLSGKGDRARLLDNLRRFGIPSDRLVIDARSSDEVRAGDILDRVGPIRFFSVDGGHWHDIVINDLTLALETLTSDGIIALDDFQRAEWPEVSSAFFEWISNKRNQICPFAHGFNKLFLCRPSKLDDYQSALRLDPLLDPLLVKITPLCGSQILVFQRFMMADRIDPSLIKTLLYSMAPDLLARWLRRSTAA